MYSFSKKMKANLQFQDDSNSESKDSQKKKAKRKKGGSRLIEWSEEDDRRLFALYKEKGSCWSEIANEFPGKNECQVKNRFYSTLRRLATKDTANCKQESGPKTKKKDLLQYVDDALQYGHHCHSKRGRKRKAAGIDGEESSQKRRESEGEDASQSIELKDGEEEVAKAKQITENALGLEKFHSLFLQKQFSEDRTGISKEETLEQMQQLKNLGKELFCLLSRTSQILDKPTPLFPFNP